MKKFTQPVVLLLGTLFAASCVTHIKVTNVQNPPPAEKFSNFTRYELKPIALAPPFAGQEANEKALVKIQENVTAKMAVPLAGWNTARASQPARTLVIEPRITEIKFISGGSRFWAGALAGSSAVILRVSISEKETGKVIATPEFYARAAAMGGAWSIGGTDNAMLVRIAHRLTDYLQANYEQAVGGVTGAEPDK